MKFDLDQLISDCKKAAKESAPQPAINDILTRAVSDRIFALSSIRLG